MRAKRQRLQAVCAFVAPRQPGAAIAIIDRLQPFAALTDGGSRRSKGTVHAQYPASRDDRAPRRSTEAVLFATKCTECSGVSPLSILTHRTRELWSLENAGDTP